MPNAFLQRRQEPAKPGCGRGTNWTRSWEEWQKLVKASQSKGAADGVPFDSQVFSASAAYDPLGGPEYTLICRYSRRQGLGRNSAAGRAQTGATAIGFDEASMVLSVQASTGRSWLLHGMYIHGQCMGPWGWSSDFILILLPQLSTCHPRLGLSWTLSGFPLVTSQDHVRHRQGCGR